MIRITFWEKKSQAYVLALHAVKVFSKSTRYQLPDGSTITIKHADTISIEEEKEEEHKMTNYTMTKVQENGCTWYAIYNEDEMKYFSGYDFMGSIDWVKDLNDAYWMSDDEAYQILTDLKAADDASEQTDPMMEKFQNALDAAVIDRDDFGSQWRSLVKDGKDDDAHRMYIRYQLAQGHLEGLTNGIFIAGYGIVSCVDSTKLIVTK